MNIEEWGANCNHLQTLETYFCFDCSAPQHLVRFPDPLADGSQAGTLSTQRPNSGSLSVWDFRLPPYPQISFLARFCPKVQLWRRLYREGYDPKVSMNPSFWLYFWYILTTYWLQFGYILPTCWLHSVTFWLHFGYILDTFCLHFGNILATFWLHSGYILATFWLHS